MNFFCLYYSQRELKNDLVELYGGFAKSLGLEQEREGEVSING